MTAIEIIDEYTRKCLVIEVARRSDSTNVLKCPGELSVSRRIPDHIRFDNGSEFTAKKVSNRLERLGVSCLNSLTSSDTVIGGNSVAKDWI